MTLRISKITEYGKFEQEIILLDKRTDRDRDR